MYIYIYVSHRVDAGAVHGLQVRSLEHGRHGVELEHWHIYIDIYIYIYMCVCVYIYICIFLYIYSPIRCGSGPWAPGSIA